MIIVVATVSDQNVGLASRSARSAAHGRDGFDQWEELGDVVAVAAGEDGRERQPAALGDEVVLGAGLAAVYRAGAGR